VTDKIQEMARVMGFQDKDDATGAREMTHETIMKMLEISGTPNSLRELGVREEDLPLLAARAMKDICVMTSPRETDEEDLLALLHRSF